METTTANTATAQQEAMQKAGEAHSEHRWLQKFIGEWTYEIEAMMGPDQPSDKATGTESVRALGDLWILGEGQGEMPCGGLASTLVTLGFDPQKQRYVGTWVGSMMNYLWVYDGELDSDEKVLTLTSEGPMMTDEGKMATYKDVIEFKHDDHRVLTSHMLGDDGQWQQFMTANYYRQS